MSSIHLCPYIRLAWYDVMQPGSDIPKRMIFDYELMYIKEGRAEIIVEKDDKEQKYIGNPGDLFFFRPRQRHSIRILDNKPLTQPHIHFDLTYSEDREKVPVSLIDLPQMTPEEISYFREDVTKCYFEDFPSCIHPRFPEYFEQMFLDLIFAFRHPGEFQEVHLQLLFLQVWYMLLEDIQFSTKPKEARKMETDMYIINRYITRNLNRQISLEELCSLVHYNKCYLLQAFKKVYKVTPHQYHAYLRFEKARDMICYTSISIKGISESLGFSSLQDFSRFFHRISGISPSMLRNRKDDQRIINLKSTMNQQLIQPMQLEHNIHLLNRIVHKD